MKTNQTRLLSYLFFAIIFFFIAITSCNKNFDEPPAYIPPNITATASIQALKAMHTAGSVDSVTTDIIIGGVVIANDLGGNWYKQIIIQDTSGGIAVNIDDYNLYASFPIGRKVYVKMKGLYLSEDAGLLYIGGAPDNGGSVSGIASRLKDQYVVKGEINVPVTPALVSIAELKSRPDKYMYTLVQFQNFEVKNSDTGKTYANATATSKTDANIIVKGCTSSDTMIIRTSGYSSFANVNVPNGNGTLTAVYAYYKSAYNGRITPQVIIRDTSDVQFKNVRCNGAALPANPVRKAIGEIRAMYKGKNVLLDAYTIGGVVISDAGNKNINSYSAILQDGNRGIAMFFGSPVSYNLGDSIIVDITGDSLINYNGSLEIKAQRGAALPAVVATGKMVTPVEMTIGQLNNAINDVEYTLVKIRRATAYGAATYGGNQKISDASGSMTLYTSSLATFANMPLPAGAKNWVGYANTYSNTKELQIRNTTDVSDTTTGADTSPTPTQNTDADLIISEYVEGSSNNKYIEIYNAGSAAADLSKYMIKMYANGATKATNQATLDTLYSAAFLPAGGIILLKNLDAALPLPSGVTAYGSSVCNFNGDDAIMLEKEETVIDAFGMVGVDPGGSWTISGNTSATADHSVKRMVSITKGNADWASSSANEWIIGGKDDVTDLGFR